MENAKEKTRINGIRMFPTEDEEQIWLFSWAKINSGKWPELELMHHIPNGGMRSKSEAARFKAMGVKRGVSDVFLPVSKGGYHGLYIELKAKDGRPEKEQKEWIAAVREQGYYAAVCYGGIEAANLVEAYMKGKVAKP